MLFTVTLTQGTVAIGWGNISGTVTNLSSGQSASFSGLVLTAGAGAGLLDFSASFSNYSGFTGGWDFSSAYVSWLGWSADSPALDFSGNRVGEIDLSPSVASVPVGALGVQVNPITNVSCAE